MAPRGWTPIPSLPMTFLTIRHWRPPKIPLVLVFGGEDFTVPSTFNRRSARYLHHWRHRCGGSRLSWAGTRCPWIGTAQIKKATTSTSAFPNTLSLVFTRMCKMWAGLCFVSAFNRSESILVLLPPPHHFLLDNLQLRRIFGLCAGP